MPLTSFFTVLISSSLASTAAPTAAILDFGVVGGDARLGTVYAERFATRLDHRGVKTSTQQAMSSMLSLERQKQLMGCSEDADTGSCMAELAGALGSTYLAIGQVAKVGSAWQVNVRTLSTKTNTTFTSFSQTVATEGAVLDAITDAADSFIFALDPRLAKPRVAPWVVAGLGFGAAAAGSVFLFRVGEANAKLRGPIDVAFTPSDAVALANARASEQIVAIGLLVGGGLALGGGLLWWALGGKQRVTLALGPASISVMALW